MVMEYLVFGLKNTEIMDAKMSEIQQMRKKTRRGKKNRQRKFLLPGNTSDVFYTFIENEEICKLKFVRRGLRIRGVRPCSPKAPMNSTQFLIDDKIDRENENGDFQNFPYPSSTPDEETDFHKLSMSPRDEDYSNLHFYDDTDDNKNNLDPDLHCMEAVDFNYEPFSVEETVDFIGEDFEKVYNFHKISDNNVQTESKVQEFSKLSKFEIIHKMLAMESRLNNVENDHSKSDELKIKMSQLREENMRLKSENSSLKQKNLFE